MQASLQVIQQPFLNGKSAISVPASALLDDVLSHPQCPAFLHDALYGKVSWQKRNEFDLSRVLAAPGMAPQFVGALLAWGAVCTFDDGSEKPLEAVLAEPGAHNRVQSITLALDIPGRVWAASRTGSTPEDWPILWAMAALDMEGGTIKDARIALTGAQLQSAALSKAASGLIGASLNEETLSKTAAAAAAEANPRGDYRGSAEYRKAMAAVVVRRALQACLEGAPA